MTLSKNPDRKIYQKTKPTDRWNVDNMLILYEWPLKLSSQNSFSFDI